MSHGWRCALLSILIVTCVQAGTCLILAADKPAPPAKDSAPAEPTGKAGVEQAPVKSAAGSDLPNPVVTPAGAAEGAANAPKYQLAYKFRAGEVVRYEVLHEGEIHIQFNEATQIDRNKSETRKNYRVASVNPDGSASLELMIDWVHMTEQSGEKEPIIFKSDNPEFQPAKYREVLETVGKPEPKTAFKSNGTPVKVQPAREATANKPVKAGEAPPDDTPKTPFCLLPDTPVAVGDTWKERFELTVQGSDMLPMKIAMLRGYRLMGVEHGRATIAFKTTVLTPIHDAAIAAQLIQREFNGTVVLDIERGILVSRDVDIDRTVINPFGAKSSMRAVSKFRERLLPGPVTAQKPQAKSS